MAGVSKTQLLLTAWIVYLRWLCPVHSGTELSARSPDLNPCDFFFWGCLKDKVYKSNPERKN
jgi:hypothetical protein